MPAAAPDSWHEHPWLDDMETSEPVSDGLIDDEYDDLDGVGGEHDERPSR